MSSVTAMQRHISELVFNLSNHVTTKQQKLNTWKLLQCWELLLSEKVLDSQSSLLLSKNGYTYKELGFIFFFALRINRIDNTDNSNMTQTITTYIVYLYLFVKWCWVQSLWKDLWNKYRIDHWLLYIQYISYILYIYTWNLTVYMLVYRFVQVRSPYESDLDVCSVVYSPNTFLFIRFFKPTVGGKLHSLVKVDPFLCELARSVLWVLIRLILHHLNTFSTFTLFMTVFADHIQLADPVLKNKGGPKRKRRLYQI